MKLLFSTIAATFIISTQGVSAKTIEKFANVQTIKPNLTSQLIREAMVNGVKACYSSWGGAIGCVGKANTIRDQGDKYLNSQEYLRTRQYYSNPRFTQPCNGKMYCNNRPQLVR